MEKYNCILKFNCKPHLDLKLYKNYRREPEGKKRPTVETSREGAGGERKNKRTRKDDGFTLNRFKTYKYILILLFYFAPTSLLAVVVVGCC